MKNSRALIAYCGLYCGTCPGYDGKIADCARDLRKELRKAKFHKIAHGLKKYFKQFKYYDQSYELLGLMVKFRCKRTCRNGGGPPFCKVRKCCVEKELDGCWECAEFKTCKKLDFLKPVHDDGHIKNIRKIKRYGIRKFLQGKKYW